MKKNPLKYIHTIYWGTLYCVDLRNIQFSFLGAKYGQVEKLQPKAICNKAIKMCFKCIAETSHTFSKVKLF